jgi:mono/diheme cytochrome c family protein
MDCMNGHGLVPAVGTLALVFVIGSARAQDAAPTQGADRAATLNVESLFATSCGWCHQGGGRVAGRGPKLAGTDKSDEFIIRQIKNGKPPGMPAFGKSFNDEQIQAIVAYIRALPDTP